ncbi:MAG: hypothetical protein HOL85_07900 [Rhodospirillaceae bacterium]|jgi:hypothetical protein|nr:hypothetical protein [Rhodospirillaceae bacterium]MBT6136614.1 hypothetical protein [Rhodospirillaceae bacterium]
MDSQKAGPENEDCFPPNYHVAGNMMRLLIAGAAVLGVIAIGPMIFTLIAKLFDATWKYYFNVPVAAGFLVTVVMAGLLFFYRTRVNRIYGRWIPLELPDEISGDVEVTSFRGKQENVSGIARVTLWFDSEDVHAMAAERTEGLVRVVEKIFAHGLNDSASRLMQDELEKHIMAKSGIPNLVRIDLRDMRYVRNQPDKPNTAGSA